MENSSNITTTDVSPSGSTLANVKKDGDDPFGLARAAESIRHALVDSTDIREREKTLRDGNVHAQKMKELNDAESERKRTFKSNWVVAGAFCFFQALIALYGFKSNNVTYILTAANGFGGFFISRKF
ncbi:hypothetical protein RI103_38755 (plasmid) [Paraburkholderia sp. FT54]|uniref:hypothetical protein n=1 Tax=Paraburkholderia sp. FT54 TaxID=3074437 RepID=UPI0028772E94|nr:hypothetical protein [Paraburkholderia sp. FT54]WNC95228.1 hypothetical protein RI103_38755 [Paraburkholderia sp. FT54]